MTLKAEPQQMTGVQTLVVVVVLVGAINVGLTGVFDINLLTEVMDPEGTAMWVSQAVIGAAGLILAIEIFTETEVLDVLD